MIAMRLKEIWPYDDEEENGSKWYLNDKKKHNENVPWKKALAQ